MTVFSLPRKFWGVAESKFYLRPLSFSSVSPYTGKRSPYGPVTQVFCCDVTRGNTSKDDWRELSGIISRQRGIAGLIRLPDTFRLKTGYDEAQAETSEPWSDDTLFSDGTGWSEGLLPTSVSVSAKGLRGENELLLAGFPLSKSAVLRSGDLFEIRPNGIAAEHGHLYEITSPSDSDSEGKARVTFEASLRATVAVGDQIVIREPMSVFRFATETEGMISRQAGDYGSNGFSFIEELPSA